ncbi:MAG: deoxyribonuclease IV [Nitrososphaerota archaeon]|jgi:deoxyribonuclease-4|nr:deoxyribonuclease IV [Nitrososphaerota archaeon]MDG6903737.1 deoxyribonuclease IV [Nitrososphaerota archaeon]MDG6912168.1 deoxyribonuclease IV [Nitrososphaerota archaeon]MDG6924585.1 deoxyribonuclease IV [Nitrososphaerota archaeon]MDG6941147.1 deoxyribonuclease IV [Nitrososphaerota archaeon]
MVGLHVSIAGSIDLAFNRAKEIGASTFQIFTRNPNQWKFKPIADETVAAFREKRKESGFRKVVDHMPYLPNLASPETSTMKISRYSIEEEVKRCDALGIDYLVIHLGSHLGKGTAVGVANIAEACNEAIAVSRGETTILLENMAGQKNSVGARFEELEMILAKVKADGRVGVCLDTCHMYASGFDLATRDAVERSLGLFDEVVGLDRLKAVHLNDSKGALGSRLDRHENIGEGKIGRRGIKEFLHYPGITERPIIMETPYEDEAAERKTMRTVLGLLP